MWIKTTDGRYLNADGLPNMVRRDVYLDDKGVGEAGRGHLSAVQIVVQYDQGRCVVLADIPVTDSHAAAIEEHFAALDDALSQANGLCDFFGLTPKTKFGHTVPSPPTGS